MTEPAERLTHRDGLTQHLEALEACTLGAARVRIATLEDALAGRGVALVALVLCLPFVQPLPVPGLSVPLGFVVALLGWRLATGRETALPGFLRRRDVDAVRLRKILGSAKGPLARLETLFRDRMPAVVTPPFSTVVAGASLISGGLALALPLPPLVLFSNSFPAWGVILLCVGLLERDGLVALAGHVVGVAVWVYFAMYAFYSWELLRAAWASALRYYGAP